MTDKYLVLRAPSGISSDMLLTGMACISGLSDADLNQRIGNLGINSLLGSLRIVRTIINHISGWKLVDTLPADNAHRSLMDILALIRASSISKRAKEIAEATFTTLAIAESEIHNIPSDKITFHEAGRLGSIMNICIVASIFDELSPEQFICSPLPVCDGVINCNHGLLATPVPAVLQLLDGVPVYGIDSSGETITPTGIALLKALNAKFEHWPAICVEKVVRVYGGKIIPNVPNGAIFILGRPYSQLSVGK